eukprot:gene48988-66508_t
MNLRTDFLRLPRLAALLLALGGSGALHAQFELKSTVGNNLWVPVTAGISRVPVSTNPLDPAVISTQPQFAGIGPTTIGTASLPAGYYLLRDGTIS